MPPEVASESSTSRTSTGAAPVFPRLNFKDLLQKLSEEHDREIITLKQRMIELSLCRKENIDLRRQIAELERCWNNGEAAPLPRLATQESLLSAAGEVCNSTNTARHTVAVPGFAGQLDGKAPTGIRRSVAQKSATLPAVDEGKTATATVLATISPCHSDANGELPAIATQTEEDEWQKKQEAGRQSTVHIAIKQETKEETHPSITSISPEVSPRKSEALPQDPPPPLPESEASVPSISGKKSVFIHDPGCFFPDGPEAQQSGTYSRGSHFSLARGSGSEKFEMDSALCLSRGQSVWNHRTFVVLDRWASDSAPSARAAIRQDHQTRRKIENPAEHSQDPLRDPRRDIESTGRCSLRHLISWPGSKYRMVWDLSGMFLIFFDIIMIPLGVFEPPDTPFTIFMSWVTMLFWSSDMLSSFFVGYVSKGETVMDPSRIACHYLRTWFVPDSVVVGVDWVLTAANTGAGGVSDVGRSLRVLRIMRTFRLLRLFKLKRILAELEDRINSEWISIMTNIVKLILLLLMASHFIACGWYFIGDTGEELGGKNWIQAQGFYERSIGYRYTTSLHWSLTQFTPASMDVQPHNAAERTFAIIILVFALVTFSSFLSSITSSMTQLRHMSEDSRKEFWMLRRYMREKFVSKQLAVRVQRYLEYAVANQRSQVPESRVKVLDLLSEQLHNELKCAVSMPSLCVHPLMRHIHKNWLITTHRLSDAAISKKHLACGDNLFFSCEVATQMYFVSAGQLQYMKASPQADLPQPDLSRLSTTSRITELTAPANTFIASAYVSEEDWISEAVLWTQWTHAGDMQAVTESTLITLDGAHFGEVICMQLPCWEFARTYAQKFVSLLNNNKFELSDVIVDLEQEGLFREVIGELLPEESKDEMENDEKRSWLKFSLKRNTKIKFLASQASTAFDKKKWSLMSRRKTAASGSVGIGSTVSKGTDSHSDQTGAWENRLKSLGP